MQHIYLFLYLADENNVNTIIYNEVKSDKENELKNLNKEIEEKKTNGLQEIKNKTKQARAELDLVMVRNDITQTVENKLIALMMGQFTNYKSVTNGRKKSESESGSDSGESEDKVKIDGMQINSNLKKKVTDTTSKKTKELKPIASAKRISRGYLGPNPLEN